MVALCRVGGTGAAVHVWDLLKEVAVVSITSTIVTFQFSSVTQSLPTLCNPLDCSPPGSSALGVFQARTLEWVAISFSRRSSQPRD